MATSGAPVSPPPNQSMKPAVAYFNTEKKGEVNELKQVDLSFHLNVFMHNLHTIDLPTSQ